jgi:hypothetical protein
MITKILDHKAYKLITTILFGLVLIGLPLTSLPLLTDIFGSMTGPVSFIPLAGLVIIWLLPYLIRRGKLPSEILPLLYFVAVAVIISTGAFFLDGMYTRGRDFFDQTIRAFITLGIGLGFYITLSAYIQQGKTFLRQALIFIYIGGFLIISWSLFEIILMRTRGGFEFFPEWVKNLKSMLAMQTPGITKTNRLTGFAYEPSWYVLFFDLTLFPILLSAIFQRKSLFNFRLWIFQVEDIMLPFGLIAFAFGFPRIALIALFVMLLYLGLLSVQKLFKKLYAWISKKKFVKHPDSLFPKAMLLVLIVVIIGGIIFSATAVFIKIGSERDYRYQLFLDKILSGELLKLDFTEDDIILMARDLAFYERTIYWYGGWHIFGDYPLGVGLGNAGFYFVDRMNSLGYGSFEIRQLLYQANHVINTKSLWVRLLAETGIVGFFVYLTWLYVLWRSAGFIQKRPDPLMKIVGLAGRLFLLAYLVEGFSVDSFAIAYPWVGASLITAGGLIARKEALAEKNETTAEKQPA